MSQSAAASTARQEPSLIDMSSTIPRSISTTVCTTSPASKQRAAPCVRLISPDATAASWSARSRGSRLDAVRRRPSAETTTAPGYQPVGISPARRLSAGRPVPARQADQRPGAEIGGGDCGPAGELVVGGDGGDLPVLDQHRTVQAVRRGVREAQHRDVDPPGPQLGDEIVGGALAQRHVDAGVRGRERPHRVGEHGVGQRGRHPDRDPAAEQPAQRGDRVPGTLDGGQRRPGVRQDRPPRLGGDDGPRTAFEQGLPQLPFELPQLRADPGLGDVQRLGRGGHRARVDGGHQVAQVPEFHNHEC